MSNMVILLNNQHFGILPAEDLIDTLIEMLQQQIYVPTRDTIEIISEQAWMKRKPKQGNRV